jgi:hypothetical protein
MLHSLVGLMTVYVTIQQSKDVAGATAKMSCCTLWLISDNVCCNTTNKDVDRETAKITLVTIYVATQQIRMLPEQQLRCNGVLFG